jgi:hypothetical protein
MSRSMVRIIIVGCILVTTLLWAAESRPRQPAVPQTTEVQEIKDPYLHSRVLVEAFVVDVNLPALYEKGVSPLGERPHSVTVQDLLQYLKSTKNAGILAGAKLAVRHQEKAMSKGTQTIYLERTTKEPGTKNFQPYDSGREFSAQVSVVSEGAISVSYAFQANSFAQTLMPQDEAPASKGLWSWSGEVTVEPGKPIIAGAVQERNSAVFLVLVAHLQ